MSLSCSPSMETLLRTNSGFKVRLESGLDSGLESDKLCTIKVITLNLMYGMASFLWRYHLAIS